MKLLNQTTAFTTMIALTADMSGAKPPTEERE